MVEFGQLQMIGHNVELEALQLRQQGLRQRQRIQIHRGELQPRTAAGRRHKAGVEIGVVGDDGPVPGEGQEGLHGRLLRGGPRHVGVPDAGEGGDLLRDVHPGVGEGVEFFQNLAAAEDHRADLGHAVVHGVEARGLDVEGHEFRVQRQGTLAVDGAVAAHIVHKIALAAVDYLHAVLFAGLPHVRESLHHAVVRHRDGGHAPVGGSGHYVRGLGESVQRGKARVHV